MLRATGGSTPARAASATDDPGCGDPVGGDTGGMTNDDASVADPSRRTFLIGMCGAAALAAGVGPALLADDAVAATGIKRKKNGKVVVTVRKVPELRKVGGRVLLGTVKGAPVAVVRTGSSTYEALDLSCTHQGVTVRESANGWTCPAHGSQFAEDGEVTRGPAMANLALVRTRWNARKGRLTVG